MGLYKLLSSPSNEVLLQEVLRAELAQQKAELGDEKSITDAATARSDMSEAARSFEGNYAFMFLGYRQEMYLWEIVVMARKAVLSVCGVALGHDPRSQVSQSICIHCGWENVLLWV